MTELAAAAADAVPSVETDQHIKSELDDKSALTPPASVGTDKPDSNNTDQSHHGDDVDGKEDEEEDDIGDITPDHYYGGGQIPVFKPVCRSSWMKRAAASSIALHGRFG